jgi:hypothetical protein
LMVGKTLKIDGSGRAKELRGVGDEENAIVSMSGTFCLPFLSDREVKVRGFELRRVMPSLSEVDGAAPEGSPP